MKTPVLSPDSRLITNFKGLSGPDFADLSGGVVTAMTDNANFPDPTPDIPTIAAQLKDYQDKASAARTRDVNSVEAKAVARVILNGSLVELARYVSLASGGSRQKQISSGIPISRRGEEVPPLGMPQNLKVKDNVNAGGAIVTVNAAKEAESYLFQYTLAPLTDDSKWETAAGTRRLHTFTGLMVNVTYFFRVAAIGTKGQVVFSKPVSHSVR